MYIYSISVYDKKKKMLSWNVSLEMIGNLYNFQPRARRQLENCEEQVTELNIFVFLFSFL